MTWVKKCWVEDDITLVDAINSIDRFKKLKMHRLFKGAASTTARGFMLVNLTLKMYLDDSLSNHI